MTVKCFGMEFPDENTRREHFLRLLAEKLKDPAFREQEGFPHGQDEAILAMSDPPWYTACPNPWLQDFIKYYGKPYDADEDYSRESMAVDVSVGKTDRIYKAHSYHTKVPHLAIVPSILHFTDPGDVVLDGFAGSGMTGVAAQWCGSAPLKYRQKIEINWKKAGLHAPKWGARRTVLNDLSPAATFIAANYNIPFDVECFVTEAENLLQAAHDEIGWMYETLHVDQRTKVQIQYTIWSEVFACRSCNSEVVFADIALDEKGSGVSKVICCPECGAESTKEQMDLAFENFIDLTTKEIAQRPKRVPYKICYKFGGKTYSKTPDQNDLNILDRIAAIPLPIELPTCFFPDCQMTRVGRMRTTRTEAIHHMYLPRAAHGMANIWRLASRHPNARIRSSLLYMVEQAVWTMSVLNRYRPKGYSQVNHYLAGVYYVPSQHAECSPWYRLGGKLKSLASAFQSYHPEKSVAMVTTGSVTNLSLPNESVDYIFTDPPFGENIYYADLNFLVESWHGVRTDPIPEAIVDRVRNKEISEYQQLMLAAFREYFRVLKPGRWMTVVFSNSRAAVWNSIQVGLQQAGFVVAEVSALDKKQGSFQQIVSPNAVKQDHVISTYKPNGGLERRLVSRGSVSESIWDFVESHLRRLPVMKGSDSTIEAVAERDPRRIYDRMVAWFVRHNLPVPISINEFLTGIRTRYAERDGMSFLPEQVIGYDRKRAQAGEVLQRKLFVSDERSAIDWLIDFIKKRPSTYQNIHPEFIAQLGAGWTKYEEYPELRMLLEDNFLRYEGDDNVPNQIHGYLSTNFKNMRGRAKNDPHLIGMAKDRWYVPDPNKATDMELKRERALLREFGNYKNFGGARLKQFRLEALRAGFKAAWADQDYGTIIAVAKKMPVEALHEDEKLLLWYDQALTRVDPDS